MIMLDHLFMIYENALLILFFDNFVYVIGVYLGIGTGFFYVLNYPIYLLNMYVLNSIGILKVSNGLEYGIVEYLYKEDFSIYVEFLLLIIFIFFMYNIMHVFYMYYTNIMEMMYITLLCFVGIEILFNVDNLISFYLVLELIGFCFYILTASYKKNVISFESGLKYFVLSSFSSIILLYGVSILYGFSGELYLGNLNIFFYNITNIFDNINNVNVVFLFSIICIFVGFLFKLYIFPFHFWVSDIYQGSPLIIAFFFSVISFFPFFFLYHKLYEIIILYFFYQIYSIYLLIAISTMLVGGIGGLIQMRIRRLLAYSSIVNVGYYMTYFMVPNMLMIRNIFFFIFVYIISLFGIWSFVLSYKFLKRKKVLENLSSFNGLMNFQFLSTFIFLLFLFSLAGIPPFPSFIAKVFWLYTLMLNNFYFIIFIVLIITIISFFFYIRIGKNIFYNKMKFWFLLDNYYYNCSLIITYVLWTNILMIRIFVFFFNPLDYLII